MIKKSLVSKQTRNNWWIDAGLFASGLLAALSGIYFLYLPVGGYQGGRNPAYGVQILFDRHTWDDLHTWSGVAIIAIAIVHFIIHWRWVVNMLRRTFKELTGRCGCMNGGGRWNLILNALVALSFLLAAVSGVYFLFFPGGRGAVDPLILFPASTWDLIHTWAGVTWIALVVVHFAIHWRWVVNVTGKVIQSLSSGFSLSPAPGKMEAR